MFLEGFTAPFCSLISYLLAFTKQKALRCPKRAQHTWKKARRSLLVSSSMFLITYFQLQSSIFTSKAEVVLSLSSYVHFILLNIIIILITSNCQDMVPQVLPDWLPDSWLVNLETFPEQTAWYSSSPDWITTVSCPWMTWFRAELRSLKQAQFIISWCWSRCTHTQKANVHRAISTVRHALHPSGVLASRKLVPWIWVSFLIQHTLHWVYTGLQNSGFRNWLMLPFWKFPKPLAAVSLMGKAAISWHCCWKQSYPPLLSLSLSPLGCHSQNTHVSSPVRSTIESYIGLRWKGP